MRSVSEAWTERARGVLEGEGREGALRFAAEVTGQAAHRHGTGRDPAAEEQAVGSLVLDLVLRPRAPDAPARLAAAPPLLAAFFQNVDLLYEHHDPGADAVSGLVMHALEILES